MKDISLSLSTQRQNGEISMSLSIDTFPPKEKALYERVKSYYDNNKPEWTEFANFWMAHLHLSGIEDDYTREEIIKLPIWDICSDLEGRIGIAQGFRQRTG